MTKMNYLFLHRPDEALATYRELLGYTKVSTDAQREAKQATTMSRSVLTAPEPRHEKLRGEVDQ
jgi:hypothetical protein